MDTHTHGYTHIDTHGHTHTLIHTYTDTHTDTHTFFLKRQVIGFNKNLIFDANMYI